ENAAPALDRAGIHCVFDTFGPAQPFIEFHGRNAAVVAPATIIEVHDRGRPGALDRVAEQINDAAFRHQPANPLDHFGGPAGVTRTHLAGEHSWSAHAHRCVPFVRTRSDGVLPSPG